MLLVFGSLNADMLFKVDTLPRPGETVLCPGYELAPGGKGANQAAAAAKAGAAVRMVGHLGDDSFGAFARDALETAGVDCSAVATTSAAATAIAVIGVDRAGENQIMVASGANLLTDAAQLSDAMLGAEGTTLLCQNEIRPEATSAAIRRASAAGARTILNLAPALTPPDEVLAALDLLVVNEIEAAMAMGAATLGDDPLPSLRALASRHDLTVVMTLGAKGALAVDPAGGGFRVGPLRIQPVDTTGAGDAFVGALAASLDLGVALPDALVRASVAAGLACTRLGAQTSQPQRPEIEARQSEISALALD
jgi:ribokinase